MLKKPGKLLQREPMAPTTPAWRPLHGPKTLTGSAGQLKPELMMLTKPEKRLLRS